MEKRIRCKTCGKSAVRGSNVAKYCSHRCCLEWWRQRRAENSRAYRKTDAGKASAKRYYLKNRERLIGERQEYRIKHREKNRLYNRAYRKRNKEKLNERGRTYSKKKRLEHKLTVVERYGGSCNCCSENNVFFLTVDHIGGNGRKHRMTTGGNMWRWLVRNDFPTGFQILCFNCNSGRYLNGGVCPHGIRKVRVKMKLDESGNLVEA